MNVLSSFFYHAESFDVGFSAVVIDQIYHHLVVHKKKALLIELEGDFVWKDQLGTPKIFWEGIKTFYIGERGKMIFWDENLRGFEDPDPPFSELRYVLAEPVDISGDISGKHSMDLKGPIALATYQNISKLLRVY